MSKSHTLCLKCYTWSSFIEIPLPWFQRFSLLYQYSLIFHSRLFHTRWGKNDSTLLKTCHTPKVSESTLAIYGHGSHLGQVMLIIYIINERVHEKTNNLHGQKQSRRSASR